LKCHRIQYKPSTSFYRISATPTPTDQIRSQKSHSCDITATHSLDPSESLASYRTSYDSQHQFIPSTTNRNRLDRPPLSVFRRISNPIISKSLTTLHSASPWQLRDLNNVR
jgi:hypothetical protein